MKVTVVIPTLNAARLLPRLLAALALQAPRPDEILVIDSASEDATCAIAEAAGCRVERIPRADFDHGGTRNRAASLATGDLLVFLTQDAVPEGPGCLASLLAPLRSGAASAAYARQVAHAGAGAIEAFSRTWNYPATGHLRGAEALERGVRGCFFSNVASAVKAEDLRAVGGFPERTIMNEDMVLCARLLRTGRAVAYAASAVVRHSHDYTLLQMFRRYFDIGVFFARFASLVPSGGATGEGLHWLRDASRHLRSVGQTQLLPRLCLEAAAKFLAYRIGRAERLLPLALKRRCSMHRGHWR